MWTWTFALTTHATACSRLAISYSAVAIRRVSRLELLRSDDVDSVVAVVVVLQSTVDLLHLISQYLCFFLYFVNLFYS